MSIRVYRLLRNNTEEGPFTAEELIQKKLRPYDLIWVDGSSAAWHYPGELSLFKRYAPLPVMENAATQTNNSEAIISPSIQAAIAVNNNLASAGIKEKPRYKVSAAWNKIQTITTQAINNIKTDNEKKSSVKKNMVVSGHTVYATKSLSWEEAWLDWEKERKSGNETTPLKSSATNKSLRAKKEKAAPVLETKYAASLDTLKDKYIENIVQQKQQQKKRSANKVSELLVPALALIIIFSVGYWFLKNADAPAINISSIKQQPAADNSNAIKPGKADEKIIPQPVSKEETQVTALADEKNLEEAEERKIPVPELRHTVHINNTVSSNKVSAANNLPAPKQDIQKLVNDISKTKDDINILSGSTNETKPANKAAVININTGNVAAVASVISNETEKPAASNKKIVADYVKVPDHIEMNNGTASINIENISDIDLDLVVVDVQYFNSSNRFSKGETFYLHNLKAGRNVVIKTPKDETSVYAASKVSLISSDTEQVYVVGDN